MGEWKGEGKEKEGLKAIDGGNPCRLRGGGDGPEQQNQQEWWDRESDSGDETRSEEWAMDIHGNLRSRVKRDGKWWTINPATQKPYPRGEEPVFEPRGDDERFRRDGRRWDETEEEDVKEEDVKEEEVKDEEDVKMEEEEDVKKEEDVREEDAKEEGGVKKEEEGGDEQSSGEETRSRTLSIDEGEKGDDEKSDEEVGATMTLSGRRRRGAGARWMARAGRRMARAGRRMARGVRAVRFIWRRYRGG
ncbi:hypothetical protein QBC40DRAFT_269876 [Triangularia verruculosa]|uniref:Uncharacterized protein n=1 Tax=Triangularia verruculosa TaxID=2587418 RepID=A0AAN6X794_9PEZI|nr:hypothetical protein QBC40DRAFT_269876 [Triangularia verruculosa]